MRDTKWLGAILLLCSGCAPAPAPTSDGGASIVTGAGVSATVLLGTFERGYGSPGLSMLALLSDDEGASWSGEVLDDREGVITSFTYGTPDGVHAVPTWWPTIPAAYGGRYTVRFFESGGREVRVKATLSPTSGLEVPALDLSPDGLRLEWPRISGAAAYDCPAQTGATKHVLAPGCAIPDGQTTVTVRALNVDLSAPIAVSDLPPSFDLSESRYVYAIGSGGSRMRAGLGSIQYTVGGASFAAFVSIQTATGTPPQVPWEIEITGPAFGSAGSLKGTQLVGTDRLILWTYDAAPVDGLYEIRAVSAAETLSFSLRGSMVPALPEVSALTVQRRGSGGALVTWQPVVGARGYYVSAWARDTGTLIASEWLTATSTTFPPGTFAAGQSCDVYVAASSADPTTGALIPVGISLSENTYRPVNFVSL